MKQNTLEKKMAFKTLFRFTFIYLTKNKLDGFNFSVLSWFLRNPTYHKPIFIALVYVHQKHLFSARLIFQITSYAIKTFLHVLHVRSYALVVLLANCYVCTLH